MNKYFEKLYKNSKAEFYGEVALNLSQSNKMFIVTANPEIFMKASKDSEIDLLLTSPETTVVADGIGVVKGSQIVGTPAEERIAGVELAEELLRCGDKQKKSVFLLGAKPEILTALCSVINRNYPELKIAGAIDGYVPDNDKAFEEIKKAQPDIILVALGVPAQEKLIFKHLGDFKKGIFVGVGGSFDVLSGAKKRAPEFFINHNIEWLYRILKEPKRIKRFYDNNIKFILKLKKSQKNTKLKG